MLKLDILRDFLMLFHLSFLSGFNNFFLNNLPKGKPNWMSAETEKIEDNYQRFSKEIMEYVDYIIPNNKSFSIISTGISNSFMNKSMEFI